jgi:hypothetical protein
MCIYVDADHGSLELIGEKLHTKVLSKPVWKLEFLNREFCIRTPKVPDFSSPGVMLPH